jgi:hypothetical protein
MDWRYTAPVNDAPHAFLSSVALKQREGGGLSALVTYQKSPSKLHISHLTFLSTERQKKVFAITQVTLHCTKNTWTNFVVPSQPWRTTCKPNRHRGSRWGRRRHWTSTTSWVSRLPFYEEHTRSTSLSSRRPQDNEKRGVRQFVAVAGSIVPCSQFHDSPLSPRREAASLLIST